MQINSQKVLDRVKCSKDENILFDRIETSLINNAKTYEAKSRLFYAALSIRSILDNKDADYIYGL